MVERAKNSDYMQIYELFKSVFKTTDYFTKLFLDYYFKDNAFVIKTDGKIISMAFVLDYEIAINKKTYKSGYVYAVATVDEHRKKGYMAQILSYIDKEYENAGYSYLFLIPAEKYLFSIYEKYGYESSFYKHRRSVNQPQKKTGIYTFDKQFDYNQAFEFYNIIEKHNQVVKSENDFKMLDKEFSQKNTDKLLIKKNNYTCAIAYTECESDVIIRQLDTFDKNEKEDIINEISGYYSKEIYYFEEGNAPFAMSKALNGAGSITKKDNVFIPYMMD